MKWKTADTIAFASDAYSFFSDSKSAEAVRPTFELEYDGEKDGSSFSTHIRYQQRIIDEDNYARFAIAGSSTNDKESGAWPFYDLVLKQDSDSDPIIKIEDIRMSVRDQPYLPKYYRADYKVELQGKTVDYIRIEGRDSWETLVTDEDEEQVVGGAELNQGWLGKTINAILTYVPKEYLKKLPVDITDYMPLGYKITWKGKQLGEISSNSNPVYKTLTLSFADDLSEEERVMAMAHTALLTYYIARKIEPPEEAERRAHLELKGTFD